MTTPIEIVEDAEEKPICPHCGEELDKVFSRRVQSFLGVRFIYYCGHCRKVLGLSHRKGFWMG